jgi:ketosteroid isomerase-like protein
VDLVRHYLARAAASDLDAYVAQFTDDAVVEDEDRLHHGRSAIRAWRAGTPRVDQRLRTVEETAEGYRADVEVSGDFPGSPVTLTYRFDVAQEGIRRLTIRPA